MPLPIPDNPARRGSAVRPPSNSSSASSTARPTLPRLQPRFASRPTLLPWPSLGWQRFALALAVPFGLGLMALGIRLAASGDAAWQTCLGLALGGFVVAATAVYSGWRTRWLTSVWEAGAFTKATAILPTYLVILLGLASILAAGLVAAIVLAMFALFLWALAAMLEEAMRS